MPQGCPGALPPHHGARVSLHHRLGQEGAVRVKYSLVPWGRGRVGLDYYIQRTILPSQGGMDSGRQGPQTWDVAEQVWARGGENGRPSSARRIRMGSWGQDAWVSPFPVLSDVLCCLVLYLFFFNAVRAGAGEQGKDLGKGHRGSPCQLGQAQSPRQAFNKLLVILTGPKPHPFCLRSVWERVIATVCI